MSSSSSDNSTPNPHYQQSNQSTDQTTNHLSNHTSNTSSSQPSHESLPVSDTLFTYTFLLPLVVEYLNDGDVVARLLIANKLIRRMLPKYTFKRICNVKKALEVIAASRDIVFSFTRVFASAGTRRLNQLLRLQALNTVPLNEVHYCCEDRSSVATIPRSATHLLLDELMSLDIDRDHPVLLTAGLIPDSVVDLVSDFQNFCLQPNSIPSSVKSLTLRTTIDKLDAAVIPDTVTDLILTADPYQSLDVALCGPLPASLERLKIPLHYLPFGAGIIPPSITSIECSNTLLSVVEAGVIPNSVKSVEVCWDQECIVKPGVLPDSVTFLLVDVVVGPIWPSPRWMPAHLTHLALTMYDMTITAGLLPATLTHLKCNAEIEPGALPNGVTHVELRDSAGHLRPGVLPHSMTHLTLELIKPNLTPGLIPPFVTHLKLACHRKQPMTRGLIPDSVTHLAFERGFQCLLVPGSIPQSVTHLKFSHGFNRSLSRHILPRSLTNLCFGRAFNHSVSLSVIPHTVTYLVFGRDFNQPFLSGDIPPFVTRLAIPAGYTHELDISNLPSSLTHLEIPRGYLKSDDKLWLPSSVTHISYKAKQFDKRPELSWNNWSVVAGAE